MNTTHKHTWMLYALIWLMWSAGMYGIDLVVEHAKVGYTRHPSILWYLVEATVLTAIFWLIEEKPFRKKK